MAKNQKAGLLIIFVTVFIDLLGFGIVMPLLPRYGDYYQPADHVLGLLMASFSAMQFVFAPIWGRVSDRVGRRPILILGLAGSTLFYYLFGLASTLSDTETMLGFSALTWLFITRIGAGIAGATIPTAQAYIADVTGPEDRARGMALIGAAFGIGFTFGPLIGAAFVTDNPNGPPSAGPGYAASMLSGIALLMAIFKLPESLRSDSRPADRHWLDLNHLQTALQRPTIGLLLVIMFLTTFSFAQFESTLSLLTADLKVPDRHNFFVFAYVGFVLTIAQGGLVRPLVKRMGEFKMAFAGAVLMSAGMLLIGWFSRGLPTDGEISDATAKSLLTTLYLIMPISVVGFAAMTPSLQAILSLRSSDQEQGGILGVGQSMLALARILGPYAGIVLFKKMGQSSPYLIAGVLIALTIFMLLGVRRPKEEMLIAKEE